LQGETDRAYVAAHAFDALGGDRAGLEQAAHQRPIPGRGVNMGGVSELRLALAEPAG
jgi:hypothetical protein